MSNGETLKERFAPEAKEKTERELLAQLVDGMRGLQGSIDKMRARLDDTNALVAMLAGAIRNAREES